MANGALVAAPALLTRMVIGPCASRALAEGGVDGGAVGDVGGCKRRAGNRFGGAFQHLLAPADQSDARAFLAERSGDRGADPGAAAGHQRVMAAEASHAFSAASASRFKLRASWVMPPR